MRLSEAAVEWILDHPIWAIGVFIALILLGAWWFESSYPCEVYSEKEEVLYYQKSGDLLIPVYGKRCLKRTGL